MLNVGIVGTADPVHLCVKDCAQYNSAGLFYCVFSSVPSWWLAGRDLILQVTEHREVP